MMQPDLRWIAFCVLFAASFATTCAETHPAPQVCDVDSFKCVGDTALQCLADGSGYRVQQDCALDRMLCTKHGCRACQPEEETCVAEKLLRCNSAGSGYLPQPLKVCDAGAGEICDKGDCVNACELARRNRSYVGCEYWAVDLDKAVVPMGGNAAVQQFAVALSNPSPLPARVVVSVMDPVDRSQPGGKLGNGTAMRERRTLRELTVAPQALEVLQLPSREVDGSPPGAFNTGTGSAISAAAYKIESSVPLIAYQFNPLSNVGVFSNDASLLIPTSALSSDATGTSGAPYVVMGWPQTVADTEDPRTDRHLDLRAFLTIVATRDGTHVRVELSTAILGDGKGIPALSAGQVLDVQLDAYQVLNLETDGFGVDADFTGSRIESDRPVAVFSGSEASDVPDPPDVTYWRCCADHMEQQLYPSTTLGKTFIALTTPSRTKALAAAGMRIRVQPEEKEYFRVLATNEFTAVTTSLAPPDDQLNIGGGEFVRLDVTGDFTVAATDAIVVGQFVAGQQDAGIPADLPGGDPSFILLPPVEQFRRDYLFLTPDKYAFDFILVAAPKGADVLFDGRRLGPGCDEVSGTKFCCTTGTVGGVRIPPDQSDTEFESYKCQLSFPGWDPARPPRERLLPGTQNDGVHRLTATQPVGLVVYGFDAFVSYGYPGGTDLELINIE